MARAVALAGVVVMLLSSTALADEEDMGGVGDLTGQASSNGEGTPEVEAVPSPAPAAPEDGDLTAGTGATQQSPYGVWDRLAGCESSGNWHIQGRVYSGGLQFDDQTWTAYGGQRYASRAGYASRDQQIAVAEKLRAARGYVPWPVCSRLLGLR